MALVRSPLPDADPALEPEEHPTRRDPRRIDRTGADDQRTDWPDQWAWEEDNLADGLGVGPFPAGRKPPRRADRPSLLPDQTDD